MKKRVLSLLLALVMLLGLLPTAALAVDEAHDHTGWTAVTMGESYIKLGGEEQSSNTLPSGCYYLDDDVNVTLIVDGSVDLCLNGHSVTVSSDNAVKVNPLASLTLWDCVEGSAGKIAYTGTGTNRYGIYNDGTLTLCGGGVEGAYRGVYNGVIGAFTMTGGSVKGINAASGYGVYNSSSSSVFRLSGGSASGGKYGVYNNSSGSKVYLSGSPTVSGDTAGIYTNSSSSYIYANDGAEENAVPYSGAPVKLAYSSYYSSGKTAVHYVTEATKGKFTLSGSISDNYELKFSEANSALQIQGKPQTLTWYGIDGEDGGALTGDGYPASHPYGAYLESTELPNPPEVEGKLFLGWLYKKSDDSDWSTRYWSDDYSPPIRSATAFKADYIDSFTGGGSGAADDPYRLATAADLQKLAALIGMGITAYNNSGVYYQLTDNIDLSTVCGEELGSWTPIGRGERDFYRFRANFDGNGKTISNLYINTDRSYQGLFYRLSGATVRNLTLTGSVAAGSDYGALAGYIDDDTVVENVDVTGVLLAPYGYTLGEGRRMAYMIDGEGNTTIHVQSNYRNNWVQTTYARAGYRVATTANLKDAVTASADFVNGGRYVQFNYTVTAGETAIADGKLAVHADIQIGDNDDAAVETVRDADGQVIGLKMVDTHTTAEWPNCISRDAQFNLYFGGTGGVTPVDTYWFGSYGDRTNRNDTYGYIYFAPLNESTKSSSGTYEQEDGVYTRFSDKDSGFALSWQNIDLAPGESRTYSFILSVGEKAEPPQWSDENAVTLTLAADAAQSRRLVNVKAKVKDAAGLTDTLYYSVDGGEGEILGEVAADGSVKTIPGQLNLSDYAEGVYLFSFWVVNSKGAASSAVEREITITPDGVEGLDGDAPAHEHAWASGWTTSATHHWHECTADGCGVTDNSGKNGYAAHVYDDDADTTCNTCGYTRTLTPPAEDTYDISGTVTDGENNKLAGVTVKLMQGSAVVATTTTDSQGNYSFHNVPAGLYNVAAEKESVTKTVLVELTDANVTGKNIQMPEGKTSSVVEVKGSETPAVVAGGVDVVAEAQEVEAGQTVTVKLTVEKQDAPAYKAELEALVSGRKDDVLYLDLSLLKTTVRGDSASTAEAITDTGETVLEIAVPYDFTGKKDVRAYRKHGENAAQTLTALSERPNRDFADGSFFADSEGGMVYIYSSKFSTYAIGYTAESGGANVPNTYKPNIQEPEHGEITVSPAAPSKGKTVTITVKPDKGYEVDTITVTDKNGKSLEVTKNANGTYAFTQPGGRATITAVMKEEGAVPAKDNKFTDVSDTAWYYDDVYYCVEKGLMKGTGDTTFAPEVTTSRAMIAAILWRLAGEPGAKVTANFPDCEADSWYAPAVAWGTENGVVKGYDSGRFGPEDPITREQLALMLFRYAKAQGVDVSVGGDTNILSYKDFSETGEWAIEGLQWAAGAGIVNGKPGGLLDPKGEVTRAETAAMLRRFCELKK